MISIIILTGPTASGKSALALTLAQAVGGEIINADSMQLYDALPLLTAQPSVHDFATLPHHLYGILPSHQISSAAWWYEQACTTIKLIYQRQKIPMVVGGTGFYLNTLTKGLSAIPQPLSFIRVQARQLALTLTPEAFYDYVIALDPLIVEQIHPNDTQRLTRALEIFLSTGKSIMNWRNHLQKHLEVKPLYLILRPPRELLYERINQRFVTMVHQGVVEEVKALLASGPTLPTPIYKAVGVPEITRYLKEEVSLEETITAAQKATRRYAKRQITWLRSQIPQAIIIRDFPTPQRVAHLISLILEFLHD